MNTSKALAVALSIGLSGVAVMAQTAVDHSQHAAGAATQASTPTAAEQQMSAMDKHLQHMRDMHKKMAEAKTDQERQALMTEHKKAMHDGMKMMGGSAGATGSPSEPPAQAGGHSAHAGGGMGAQMMQRHALMEKRMEMMQTMMQMMMDHMHTPRASQ